MTEWKLFADGEVPGYTTNHFFAGHPWVDPIHQRGHAERIAMVRHVIGQVVEDFSIETMTDLGCGDGSLLELCLDLPIQAWGYDLGVENINVARNRRGVNAMRADFLLAAKSLMYGELLVTTEVVEHLVDPRGFLRSLLDVTTARILVVSSPWDENELDHYEHHAWAWNQEGYREMVESTGWQFDAQATCEAGFQTITARRF